MSDLVEGILEIFQKIEIFHSVHFHNVHDLHNVSVFHMTVILNDCRKRTVGSGPWILRSKVRLTVDNVAGR